MTDEPDLFRNAVLALMDLPVDERTAAFNRLIDEWLPREMVRVKAAGDGWQLVSRTTAMWAVGYEIGVINVPPMME